MTRDEKLRAAYEAGVTMVKAKRPDDNNIDGIHICGPSIGQILDAIIKAYDTGHKTVVVHDKPKLYLL